MKTGTKVYLRGDKMSTEGRVRGMLDEMVRVRWSDGQNGIYAPSALTVRPYRPWSSTPYAVDCNHVTRLTKAQG